MGKKDGKKADKAKVEAKKARQAAKQEKTSNKRTKKELKETIGEEDIETLLAQIAAKDAARTAVTTYPCEQPTPRANFSMTALPNGDMLLFGGEFCDGERTEVYNDLYRWNVDKNEWKKIESVNTPPPRCSHQAVFYRDKVYVFGGEYATLDQFYHYKDFWELDVKTSTWREIALSSTVAAAGGGGGKAGGKAGASKAGSILPALDTESQVPSARSGHRMAVWRGYLILFGGFYEAVRDARWFNDVYIFSFQEEKWARVPYKSSTQVPKPRSGLQMSVFPAEDCLYIYGGYSKEKMAGQGSSKIEGRIHEDMWQLNLKPALPAAGAQQSTTSSGISGMGRFSGLDVSKITWQKVARKGDFPSARCGSAMVYYKNKALMYGGVFDYEGPRHALLSTFYSDLYALDMERRRWYKLGIKEKKTHNSSNIAAGSQAKLGGNQGETAKYGGEYRATANEEEGEESEDREQIEGLSGKAGEDSADFDNCFGFIDENGTVTYIKLAEEQEGGEAGESCVEKAGVESENPLKSDFIGSTSALPETLSPPLPLSPPLSLSHAQPPTPPLSTVSFTTDGVPPPLEQKYVQQEQQPQQEPEQQQEQQQQGINEQLTTPNITVQQPGLLTEKGESLAFGAATTVVAAVGVGIEDILGDNGVGSMSYVAKYFATQSEPCPRINPAVLIRGNTLFVYGGVTELGETEITLDDCWALDLNKRDRWRKVLSGRMHEIEWKGGDDGGTECSADSSNNYYNDDNNNSDIDSDDESDDSADSDDGADQEQQEKEDGGGNFEDPKKDGKDRKDRKGSLIGKRHGAEKRERVDEREKRDGEGEGEGEGVRENQAAGLYTSRPEAREGREPREGRKAGSARKGTAAAASRGLRAEMEAMRVAYGMTETSRTPLSDETLRQFYCRTAGHWAGVVQDDWRAKFETNTALEPLSEKEIKRLGFAKAEERFQELSPHLAKLSEMETQQLQAESGRVEDVPEGGKGSGGGRQAQKEGKLGKNRR